MANATYPVNSAGSAAFVTTVSALVFAFLVPICSAGGVIQPAVVAALAGIFAEMSRRHVVRKLVASLKATDADASLDVYINGAKVGSIASIDVISLKLDALRDPRNYAAQFVNILGVAGRGTLAALILVPLMLFWAYVGLGLDFPRKPADGDIDDRPSTTGRPRAGGHPDSLYRADCVHARDRKQPQLRG